MVQFVERLPGKHEDSTSITSTAKLGVAMAAAPELVVSPVSWRSRDRPGACWLASSTWVIFRAMGNPVSKDRVDGASWGMTLKVVLWPLNLYAHTWTCMHTHIKDKYSKRYHIGETLWTLKKSGLKKVNLRVFIGHGEVQTVKSWLRTDSPATGTQAFHTPFHYDFIRSWFSSLSSSNITYASQELVDLIIIFLSLSFVIIFKTMFN